MSRAARPLALAGLIAFSVWVSAPLAQSRSSAAAPEKIRVTATPIGGFEQHEPERVRFGALEFRGGVVLTTDHARFGGISGLRMAADGEQFLALTDRGYWLRGRIVAEGDRPIGIADAEISPLLGSKGRPLVDSGWRDTESLAADDGRVYVGVERVNRIVRFDYAREGLSAHAKHMPVPAAMRELPPNQGVEAMAFVPRKLPLGGTLIAISERGLDSAGNILGFLIGGRSPGSFTVRRSNEFDITDAALTPDGDLLILERHFSFARGVGMRLRRVALSAIKPGTTVDGTVLVEAGNSHQIDNMEALATHRNAAGETILTLISDDNFNPWQRTILLRFALMLD